ncbi:6097_t:CDS:1 [Acaulospora morrowiae]|uniref:Succinate dehydrogenase assembly factor 3 n=1 Tax=Acaulospora morrowiae TaxID=94023 RepID=A0A9N8W5N0_9GLOM|nr:6097_t:CDS:1 [Acaulospora morrowiae]
MASKHLSSRPKNLYPPLTLYRQILRIHRRLPPSLRLLGDDYVKSEFRRHRDVTNPLYLVGFFSQWQSYLEELKQQTSASVPVEEIRYGKKLDSESLEKFSEQQLGQLYELRNETKASINKESSEQLREV